MKELSGETMKALGGDSPEVVPTAASRRNPSDPPAGWPDWMKDMWKDAIKEFPLNDQRAPQEGGLVNPPPPKVLAPWDSSPDPDQLVMRKDTPWIDAERDENVTKSNRETVFLKVLANRFKEAFEKKYRRPLSWNENHLLHKKLKRILDRHLGNTDDQIYDRELTDPNQDPSLWEGWGQKT